MIGYKIIFQQGERNIYSFQVFDPLGEGKVSVRGFEESCSQLPGEAVCRCVHTGKRFGALGEGMSCDISWTPSQDIIDKSKELSFLYN